jgi:hypothetical protein
LRGVRGGQFTHLEAAVAGGFSPRLDGLDVRFDDLGVLRAAAGEPFPDERLEVLDSHLDELGDRADDDHIGRARVVDRLGDLVDRYAEAAPAAFTQVEILGVVDNDPALAELENVVVVGVPVERHQDVEVVALALHRVGGDPHLGPGRAAEDL